MARCGGSSRIFQQRVGRCWFISSAPSTIATRQPPSAGVRLMKALIPRTSSTAICVRIRRRFSSHSRSTVSAGRHARGQRRAGTPGAQGRAPGYFRWHTRQQPASEAVGQRRLADAVGPVISQAWWIRPERIASSSTVSAASWPSN